MSKLNKIESTQEKIGLKSFKDITENTTNPLFENLGNDKNYLSTFREEAKAIIDRLHLPNPKFIAQLKKYLKEKTKDHKNTSSINDYLKRADIINFQETLDNWEGIEEEDLQEQIIELSKSCSSILDLLDEELGDENLKTKKEKKQQDYEIEKYRDDSDDEEKELYEKYGYAV